MRFFKSLLRGLAVLGTLGALTVVSAATNFNQIDGTTPMYTAADVDGIVATLQPLDSDLSDIAALTTQPHGRSLLTGINAAASRSTLGLVIGTDVQAWDADLDAVAAISTTSFGRDFLSLVNDSAARTYLNLGTAATQSSGAFAAASHTHAATDITSGSLDGDRLPALSTTKRGGVPATGTPSGKFLRDDDTWASPSSGGVSDGDYGDVTVSGTGATWTVDSGAVSDAELSVSDVTTNNVSTSAHGFVPKAPNNTTQFLRADASWAVPSLLLSTVSVQTGDYTITTSDDGALIHDTSTSSQTITLPNSPSVGFRVGISYVGGSGTFLSVVRNGSGSNLIYGPNPDQQGVSTLYARPKTSFIIAYVATNDWRVLGFTSAPLTALKTSDQTAIGTAYADVTSLGFALQGGKTYSFEYFLVCDSDATTTGIDVAVNGPASPTFLYYSQVYWTSATAATERGATAYDANTASTGSNGTAAKLYRVFGTIKTSALNPGTLIPRAKREAVGTGPNVRAGSWGRLTPLD